MVKDINKLLEEYESKEKKEEIATEEKPEKKRREVITKENISVKKIKLDAYDRKILELLLQNSRESINIIGKKVRLSRENVDYRIKRMIKDGLISSFNVVFDEKKLGLLRYGVFLELINLNNNNEKRILTYLKENKNVSWASTNAGKWSLVFDVLIKQKEEFDNLMNTLLSKFHKFIGEYSIISVDQIDYYSEKMLNLKVRKQDEKKFGVVKIDKIDSKIISMLNEDAWSSYVKIAGKVGLTANAVNKRVENMENKGIIVGYTASLDWKKLGFELYGLQLKIIKFDNEQLAKLISYLSDNNNIMAYYKYFGGAWDYDIGVIVRNSEELRKFIKNFRETFSDFIKISDVSIILSEETSYKLPQGVFD